VVTLPTSTVTRLPMRQWVNSLTTAVNNRGETWLPFTQRLVIKPDLGYLAKSALLTRLFIGGSRSYMNKDIDDPKLSPPQKKQAFLESCFKELFGTPSYMLVMHLSSDVMGYALQKLGFIPKQLAKTLPTIKDTDLTQANALLHDLMGQKGWVGKAVFNPEKISLTQYKVLLNQYQLGHLLNNPVFDQAMTQWFKRLKLGGSLGFVAQMLANILYGGIFIQQFNDKVVAPCLEKRLYRPDSVSAGRRHSDTSNVLGDSAKGVLA
jgi:hypothetical protein